MRKTLCIATLLVLAALVGIANALTPDTITITWLRSDTTGYADTQNVYMAGVTYRLTNCVAGITTNLAQDLTGLRTTIRVGDNGTNIQYVCTNYVGTNGLFGVDFKFPTWTPGASRGVTGQGGIELTIAETNTAVPTVSVTYKARKLFMVTQPLQ